MADKVACVGAKHGSGAVGCRCAVEHYVEGLCTQHDGDDYYRYREQSHALFGENTKRPTGWATRSAFRSFADMNAGRRSRLEGVLAKVRRDERRGTCARSTPEKTSTKARRRKPQAQTRLGKKSADDPRGKRLLIWSSDADTSITARPR